MLTPTILSIKSKSTKTLLVEGSKNAPPFGAMSRIAAMLRLTLVMTALFSSAAAIPLVRGGEDLLEAWVHRKELPHRDDELQPAGVPPELLVKPGSPSTCGLASCLCF